VDIFLLFSCKNNIDTVIVFVGITIFLALYVQKKIYFELRSLFWGVDSPLTLLLIHCVIYKQIDIFFFNWTHNKYKLVN